MGANFGLICDMLSVPIVEFAMNVFWHGTVYVEVTPLSLAVWNHAAAMHQKALENDTN